MPAAAIASTLKPLILTLPEIADGLIKSAGLPPS